MPSRFEPARCQFRRMFALRIALTMSDANTVAALAAERQAQDVSARLTSREVEVATLIREDLSNKEIAVRLGIEVADGQGTCIAARRQPAPLRRRHAR